MRASRAWRMCSVGAGPPGLQLLPYQVDGEYVVEAHRRDDRPAVGQPDREPLIRQPPESLSDWSPAHRQFAGQLVLAEPA